jgi:hypothetical protein
MNKFTTLLILFLIIFLPGLNAQTTTRPLDTEIGIRLWGLNDFDFIYKKQKKENRYTRIRFVTGDFTINDFKNFNSALNLGLGFGKETHKPIHEHLSFIRGYEIIASAGNTIAQEQAFFYVSPGLGLVLGLQYDISQNFSLTLETIPGISTNINFGPGGTKVTGLSMGFNSNNIALGLMYKFQTGK